MCIYYLISFTKSIYFLLNFQIPFMFWIIILLLNILYYPTNESIRFSNNLIFLTVLRFIVISATFWSGFGELFWGFLLFQLLFLGFFPVFWLSSGAVLGISAVSATFYRFFSSFLAEFGSCFGDFCCFSYFFSAFSGFLAGFGELFWGFLQFQLLFTGFSPAFWLGLGSCFGDFCCFSYFLPAFLRLLG